MFMKGCHRQARSLPSGPVFPCSRQFPEVGERFPHSILRVLRYHVSEGCKRQRQHLDDTELQQESQQLCFLSRSVNRYTPDVRTKAVSF